MPSYNWACAIDDWDGRFRLIVRASDLRSVLPQQRAIQGWLSQEFEPGRLPPAVFHTALVVQSNGVRLEKRTRGVTRSELEGRGVSGDALIALFGRGFNPAQALVPPPGGEGGENPPQISLAQLELD